ncbi:MAG: VOC family protein, partial [Bacteroidota bacterium]
ISYQGAFFLLEVGARMLYTPTMNLADGIDHIIITAAELEQGCDWIEAQLGIRPVVGGQHPLWGTHNALLALGEDCYLEVVAPDPRLRVGERGLWLGDYFDRQPQLSTWAFREAVIPTNSPYLGSIEAGKRQKPDGSWLRWRLTDPYVLAFDGAMPFVIDWGESRHPSLDLPSCGERLALSIVHPQAQALREALDQVGIQIVVKQGPTYNLIAEIQQGNKTLTLNTSN